MNALRAIWAFVAAVWAFFTDKPPEGHDMSGER